MIVFIVLMLTIIGTQMVAGIYANINPFIEQLGSIQQYNIAYYGAISSIERAELTLRGHEAGFEGSGGWMGGTNYGNSSDHDFKDEKYWSYLSWTGRDNGMTWEIYSMSDSDGLVPKPGEGNLDVNASSGNDYKKLSFDRSLQYAFYQDDSGTNDYYTGSNNISDISLTTADLEVSIRVPMKVYEEYDSSMITNMLDLTNDLDDDGITDDMIVNRSIFGYTGDTQFTIFPTINVDYTSGALNNEDTAIRESDINDYDINTNDYNIVFGITSSEKTNPSSRGSSISEFNQSPQDAVGTGFDKVFDNSTNIEKLHLKFSLVNFLKRKEDEVYPYLEVKLKSPASIPLSDFRIYGRGKVGEYDVNIRISKPVFNTTAASDFTVLF